MQRKGSHDGIQACRIKAGFATAREAAEALDMSKSTYEGWEQGRSFPKRPAELRRMADLFSCSIDDLYGYVPVTATVAVDGASRQLSDEERRLLAGYTASDDNGRAVLLTLADALAGKADAVTLRSFYWRMADALATATTASEKVSGGGSSLTKSF